MWQYSQSTGALTDASGVLCGIGYSGHGQGVNNPAMQAVPDVGPIPAGLWSVGPPQDDLRMGPFVLALTAMPPTVTFGRGGFFVHGDSVESPDAEQASHGCIVLPRQAREQIWERVVGIGTDHVLKVVP